MYQYQNDLKKSFLNGSSVLFHYKVQNLQLVDVYCVSNELFIVFVNCLCIFKLIYN